jgi:hypothetical protein
MPSTALVTLARGLPHLQSLTYECESWPRYIYPPDLCLMRMRRSIFIDFLTHASLLTSLRLCGSYESSKPSLHLPKGWGCVLVRSCPALTHLDLELYNLRSHELFALSKLHSLTSLRLKPHTTWTYVHRSCFTALARLHALRRLELWGSAFACPELSLLGQLPVLEHLQLDLTRRASREEEEEVILFAFWFAFCTSYFILMFCVLFFMQVYNKVQPIL